MRASRVTPEPRRDGETRALQGELEGLLFGPLPRGEIDGHAIRALSDAGAEANLDRRRGAVELVEAEDDTVAAPVRLALGEVDILDVLPLALAVARAVAVLQEACARGLAEAGELACGIVDVEIDVGVGDLPGDHELEDACVQAAALVDDAVAVVVAGVEAELDAGGRAGHLEAHTLGGRHVAHREGVLGRRSGRGEAGRDV